MNKDHDFILAPLQIGQPPRPVFVLTPWTKAAEDYIKSRLNGYPRFCEHSVGLPRNHVQNVITNIRNQGLIVK